MAHEKRSLTSALDLWFSKPFAQLPKNLQRLVERHFLPEIWDTLTPTERHIHAKQIDAQNPIRSERACAESAFWKGFLSAITKQRNVLAIWFREKTKADTRRGRARAKRRWDRQKASDTEVNDIIKRLAVKKDSLDDPLPPSELWPEPFAALDDAGLKPTEKDNPSRYVHVEGKITFDAFRKRIQLLRK